MTNQEILNIFKNNYPTVVVEDFRPIDELFMPKGKQGITIWLENGDIILYFPHMDTE